MKKPYVIAELGVNFYDTARVMGITPLEAAKLYVKKAKEAGIDAAKFQSYKAETIASKNSPSYWDLTKEPTTSQYELFKKLDGFNQEDYEELYHYCKEVGIDFMSTPFDYHSADYLENYVDAGIGKGRKRRAGVIGVDLEGVIKDPMNLIPEITEE